MGFASVSRPTRSNKGGLNRLLLADVDDVVNESIRLQRGTGYVAEPILLESGKTWIEMAFTPKTLSFKEPTKRTFGGSMFPCVIEWRQGKDEPQKIDQFRRMEKKRFIGLVQNNNLDWLVIGTPDEPAVFSWTDRTPGQKATEYNGYTLELRAARRESVAFYKVFAIFSWNSSGQLIFDNTFDPTLSATVDANGVLEITGPNEGLYTENGGILYYTG